MTPQQVVGLGVRLLALWLASENIGFLFSMPSFLRGTEHGDKAIYAYIIGGWWLVLAVVLWFFPMWIAHKLIPRTRFDNKLDIHAFDAARVGCSLLGLWFLLIQMRTVIWLFIVGALNSGTSSLVRSLNPDDRLRFGIALAQTFLALVLIFFSHRFASLVLRESAPASSSDKGPESAGV
jgi:hypothetical protein